MVGAVAGSAATLFALVRAARLGGGPGTFVVAGTLSTDPATVVGGIPVIDGPGFDGQFYYRLAHNPAQLGLGRVYGIAIDNALRPGRILYPALAWLGSLGGRAGLLAWAMVVVNVAAVAAIGYLGAVLARDHGRDAVWGLVLAGYWGFGFVLARDLTELTTAVAVFAMLLLAGRGRYVFAGVAGCAAVLGREQAVAVVAAIAIGVFVHEWRRRSSPQALRAALAIAVPPAAVFVAWQSICRHVTGEWPATASSDASTTWPFADVPGAVGAWSRQVRDGLGSAHLVSIGSLLAPLCFLGLVWLVVWSLASGGARAAWVERPWEVLVVAAAALAVVCSARVVIDSPGDFRQSGELAGTSWLMIWSGSPRSRRWALVYALPVAALAIGFRCLTL